MTTEICEFDKKWKKRVNNNTWNSKDTVGIIIIVLVTTILINFITLFFNNNKKINIIIIITFILILTIIIYTSPVSILYPASSIIALTTRTPEFLDRFEYFPNCKHFENKYTFTKIQKELQNFMDKTNDGNLLLPTSETYGKSNKYIGSGGNDKNKWRLFQIKVLDKILPGAENYFPTVVKLCKKFPEILACVISVLEPNVTIPSHVGYMKGVVRYMLPLKVPKDRENIYLCVNKKKYNWTEGEGVLWDDCYPHMVVNNTDETRIIIYFDIKRKNMSKINNALLNASCKIINNSPVIKKQISTQEKQIKNF